MDGNHNKDGDLQAAPLSDGREGLDTRTPAQIIVLGMHRSGTSAMTGALHRMGVFVGDEEALTGKNWENPLGFFERRDARAICDRLLHGSDADWWKVANFDPERIPHSVLPGQLAQMKTMMDALEDGARESAKNGGALAWAIKEPRLCLLFPVFRRAFINPIPIYVVRHPLETALSLRHRNGFALNAGLALWEAYNVAVLRNLGGLNPVRTPYEDLILQPQETLSQIATVLHERGITGLKIDNGREGIRESLKREEAASDQTDGPLSPAQSMLWEALSSSSEEEFLALLQNPPELSDQGRAVLLDFETDEASRQSVHAEVRNLRGQLQKEREANSKTIKAHEDAMQASDKEARQRVMVLESNLEAQTARAVEWREGAKSRDGAIAILKEELAEQRQSAEANAKRIGEQEKTVSLLETQFTDYKALAAKSVADAQERVREVQERAEAAQKRADAAAETIKTQHEKLKSLEAAKATEAQNYKGELDKTKAATKKTEKNLLETRARTAELRKERDRLAGKLEARRAAGRSLKKSLRWRLGGLLLAPAAPLIMARKFRLNRRFKAAAAKIEASNLFDREYYTDNYPDVAESDIDPLTHYLASGWREGRNPGPQFDVQWYLEKNQDVRDAGVEPLLHYIESGRDEGRSPLSPHSSALLEIEETPKRQASSETGGSISAKSAKPAKKERLPAVKTPPSLSRGPDLFAFRSAYRNAEKLIIAVVREAGDIPALRRVLDNWVRDDEDFSKNVNVAIITQGGSVVADWDTALGDINPAVIDFPSDYAPSQMLMYLVNEGPLIKFASLAWITDVSDEARVEEVLTIWRRQKGVDAKVLSDVYGPAPVDEADGIFTNIRIFFPRLGRERSSDFLEGPVGNVTVIPALVVNQLRAYGIRPAELKRSDVNADPMLSILIAAIAEEAGAPTLTPAEATASDLQSGVTTTAGRVVKTIAFYLPQFHPIDENDAWWGAGFTEWSNVTKARPLYRFHHQPQLPADLGFYDLRTEDTQIAQANLAHDFGLHGFCYYYYWFDGKKVLNRPIEQMLESGSPNLPFCVCWANENWSRNWDGQNKYVLLEQHYSMETNRGLIQEFIKLMKDSRYICYKGKPVLLVYRIRIIPNWLETAEMWREECRKAGIGEIHLCAVRFGLEPLDGQPEEFGLDAFVLFPPHEARKTDIRDRVRDLKPDFNGEILDYDDAVTGDLSRFENGYEWPVHRGVMLGWDNTARRPRDSRIFLGSTPARLHYWIKSVVEQEAQYNPETESLLFVNAWNEWAEGTMLEPSIKFGRGYLEAVKAVVGDKAPEFPRPTPKKPLQSTKAISVRPPAVAAPSRWVEGDVARLDGAPTILLCAHVVSHQLFGGERSFLDMLDALRRLRLNVIVALPTDKHPFYIDLVKARCSGVSIIEYKQWRDDRSPEAGVTAAFVSLIKERRIDLVYANTIVLLEPLEAARLCGVQTAVHVRELIDRDEHLCDHIGLTASEIIDRVFEASDYVIANSEETAELFYRENKTFCAPNVVDIEALDIENDISSPVRFAIASSNIPKKGVGDFIEVARRCATLGLKAEFIVVGPENTHLEAWKSGAPANVEFAGYRDTPAAAMAEGNVILSLSHFAESFGRTVAEAHAARRPVIAYKHGAVPELIDEGKSGYLTAYRNIDEVVAAVRKVCENPSSIIAMGEAGRARVLRENAPDVLRRNLQSAMSDIFGVRIAERSASNAVSAPSAQTRFVTIIVPVFNAYAETRNCLESLAKVVDFEKARVLILDDASTDGRVRPLLEEFSQRDGIDLISHQKNMGYTANINVGVKAAGNDDVILLNSDTIVTPGFVEGLQRAVYAKNKVGTATAMGDNAGAFSFPIFNEANPKPEGVSYDDHAAAILNSTKECHPVAVPTGSGFCFYIRRALINEIGLFDEEAFPRGYGEENDFCMRGLRAGWGHVISPYAYVFHVRSASFGDEKALLINGAVDTVTKRYPEYAARVKDAFASDDMAALRRASAV